MSAENQNQKFNWSLAHWSSPKGFSLLELLFAMTFLTLIIFGVVKLQTGNLAMLGGQNNQITARLYATQGTQIMRAIGKTGIDTAWSAPQPPAPVSVIKYLKFSNNYNLADNETDSEGKLDNLFTRSILIEKKTELTNAYKVTVRLTWTDATGEHATEAKTIVY